MNSCYSHSIANTLRADRIESAKCGLHLDILSAIHQAIVYSHAHLHENTNTHTKVSLTVEIL